MKLTKEEFDFTLKEVLDSVLVAMAEHEDVELEKFYSMTCILENLAFFSPVIYSAIKASSNISE